MSTFTRLGYWAALACGAAAVAYGVVSILVVVIAPAALTWDGYELFVADYRRWPTMAVLAPPFVVTAVFPVLVLAVYATVGEARRPFALLALVFAGVYSAVLGAAYWLQLTNVPWNVVRGATDGIAPWVLWNPASFFWSLETFAYFAMGVSCVFAALAYEPGILPRRLRTGLLAMGALGVYFLSTALKDVVFNADAAWVTAWSLSAFAAWVVLFAFVAFGLARWFSRADAAAERPIGGRLPKRRVKEPSW